MTDLPQAPSELEESFALAWRALAPGGPLPAVQRAMGHGDLATTVGYYRPGRGEGPVAGFLEGDNG